MTPMGELFMCSEPFTNVINKSLLLRPFKSKQQWNRKGLFQKSCFIQGIMTENVFYFYNVLKYSFFPLIIISFSTLSEVSQARFHHLKTGSSYSSSSKEKWMDRLLIQGLLSISLTFQNQEVNLRDYWVAEIDVTEFMCYLQNNDEKKNKKELGGCWRLASGQKQKWQLGFWQWGRRQKILKINTSKTHQSEIKLRQMNLHI